MDTKTIVIIILVAVAAFLAGGSYWGGNNDVDPVGTFDSAAPAKVKAILYKEPGCGCCGNYASALRGKGFDVEVVETDMGSIKTKYNIPRSLESCHTTVIGDYVVEGHIPFEAIEKLLAEKPDVAGIALPGMPSGSPGMPGAKLGKFQVRMMSESGEDMGMFMEM